MSAASATPSWEVNTLSPQLAGQEHPEQQGKRSQIDNDRDDDVCGLRCIALGLHGVAAQPQVAQEDGAEDAADGVAVGQECHRNAVKTGALDGLEQGVLPAASQVKQAAAETGQRAGDDHRQYDVLFGADACVHGGVSVVAAGLQLIAKGGLLQDDPDDQGDDNGQEETNIHVAVLEQLIQAQPGQNGAGVGVGQGGGPVRGGGAPVGVQHPGHVGNQEIHQVHADPVEHDGSQHLVDVEEGFEEAREKSPNGAAHSSGQETHIPGHLQLNGAGQGQESANGVLPRGADVKESHFVSKGHSQAHHHQGGSPVQDVAHVGEAFTEETAHAGQGVAGIQQQQQEKAKQKADADGGHGGHDAQQAGIVPQAG